MKHGRLALGGPFELNESCAAVIAAEQASAAPAGEETGATLPVEHREDGSVRLCADCGSNQGRQPGGVSARMRVLVPGVDQLDRCPP